MKMDWIYYISMHLVHEVTSPQAFEGLRLTNRTVRRPDLTFATMDHNIPTKDVWNITDRIAKAATRYTSGKLQTISGTISGYRR